nr:MAG TPA: hypothetical protein [Caudoviricetes sp.]
MLLKVCCFPLSVYTYSLFLEYLSILLLHKDIHYILYICVMYFYILRIISIP